METRIENIILLNRYKKIWQPLYWVFATLILFFVFSSKAYDLNIRILVVLTLATMSFFLTLVINKYLILNFLFARRYSLFLYLLVFAVSITIWISFLCLFLILWYTASYFHGTVLPNFTDLILLISGSYLITLFASIVHFVKETFTKQMEHERISQQKVETELKLKEAQLKLLQGQLQPHFLFNMLNNLYGLWMERSDATPEVILKLSALLDYMLYECNQEKVPLKNEVQFIRNYIDLETIRYDNRLKLNINFPDSIDNQTIAPLILFSFVENAFKHGANRNSGESNISINLISTNRSIDFVVVNNFTPSDSTSTGIGLKNVEERLNLLYRNKYRLIITTENNQFTVSLHLEIE